ncbi:hypothetical protein CONCODRAFT_80679 [Conidiobolus coronatus NRRL 28638]|uniref:L-ornithine N(5)-monooxygenase [NAD(P)H] n=1 Tax=Conidiobolus coronatus (strain ATCC 28846 / CBS 209.66 / NRRL 28638) TaxID=796925 RepID=A0A137NSZ6_CONC2|nr:hypothetical protein CONCODRAFT_80679 [Conidiobolus coronatus NRRL 28638]|eukprot:KXN65828.1 hypothetical protein CONCODRAFT_80679 [Conidiobolus coronatus NRRL 28638]
MSWVADQFAHLCSYNEEVTNIEPIVDAEGVKIVKVTSKLTDGTIVERWARNIIVAIGGQANIPSFPGLANLPHESLPIIHSSQYLNQVDRINPDSNQPTKLAIVGSGQSAAELFMDLLSRYPKAHVSMICRDTALRPADETPFVNQIFNPASTSQFYKLTPEQKKAYLQKEMGLTTPASIHFGHSVQDITYSNNKMNLKLSPIYDPEATINAQFDGVIMATGYTRQLHKKLLSNITPYFIHSDVDNYGISRDYSVPTKSEFKVGVYLQGCNEPTHGLSDTLLSVLAIRGPEVVDSLTHSDESIKEIAYANLPTSTEGPFINAADLAKGYRWESFDSSEAIGGYLKHHPSFSNKPVELDASGVPKRASAPSPGQLLYSRYIPELDNTLTIKVFDMEQNLEDFHNWMNTDRVNEFWQERGSMEYHKSYILNLFDNKSNFPVIAYFDGEPFAYFEFYWAKEALIGKYYEADNFDRGSHMLIGNEKFRGKDRIMAWMPSMCHYLMLDHPKTKNVMAEPHARNEKIHRCFYKNLYNKIDLVQFPHKPAVLVQMQRDTLFKHPSLQSMTDPLLKKASGRAISSSSSYSVPSDHSISSSTTTNSSDSNENSSPNSPIEYRKLELKAEDLETIKKLPALDGNEALLSQTN